MVQVFAQKLQGIERGPLEAAIAPVLAAHGVDTAGVSYQMEPVGWVLRITVESLEEGHAARLDLDKREDDRAPVAAGAEAIDLGLLTEIARDLSSALDVADVIPHRYHLEVSSPGLERRLRSARDFERAVGRLAKVHLLRPAEDGQRVLRGKILEAGGGVLRVEVDGKPIAARLDDVERAHLIFELPAQRKTGRPKPGKHTRH